MTFTDISHAILRPSLFMFTRALALGCVRPVYAVPLVAHETAAASSVRSACSFWSVGSVLRFAWLAEEERGEEGRTRTERRRSVCAVEVGFSKTSTRTRSGPCQCSVLISAQVVRPTKCSSGRGRGTAQ